MCRLQKFMDTFWKDKGPNPQPHDPPILPPPLVECRPSFEFESLYIARAATYEQQYSKCWAYCCLC